MGYDCVLPCDYWHSCRGSGEQWTPDVLSILIRSPVKPHRIGDTVKVRSVSGGYALPEGLPENAMVRVIALVHVYRLVEWQGQEFKVYVMNLDTGLLTFV